MTGQPRSRQDLVDRAAGATIGGGPLVGVGGNFSRGQSLPGGGAKRFLDSRAVKAPHRPCSVHALRRARSLVVRPPARLLVPTYFPHRLLAYQVPAAATTTATASPLARAM
jgi:hypothetical protein